MLIDTKIMQRRQVAGIIAMCFMPHPKIGFANFIRGDPGVNLQLDRGAIELMRGDTRAGGFLMPSEDNTRAWYDAAKDEVRGLVHAPRIVFFEVFSCVPQKPEYGVFLYPEVSA